MGIQKIELSEVKDIIAKARLVGYGSFGDVYDIGNDQLFKFYYEKFKIDNKCTTIESKISAIDQNFAKCLRDYSILQEVIKNGALVPIEDDFPDIIERYRMYTRYKVMQASRSVKRSSPPRELIFAGDRNFGENNLALVGSILKREEGVELEDVMMNVSRDDVKTKRKLEENLYDGYMELMDHGIYTFDLKSDNIIVNPDTLETKIIDLDDPCTEYYDQVNKEKRAKMFSEIDQMFSYEIEKRHGFQFKR